MRRRQRALYGSDGFARSHFRSVLLLLVVVPVAGATKLSPRLRCPSLLPWLGSPFGPPLLVLLPGHALPLVPQLALALRRDGCLLSSSSGASSLVLLVVLGSSSVVVEAVPGRVVELLAEVAEVVELGQVVCVLALLRCLLPLVLLLWSSSFGSSSVVVGLVLGRVVGLLLVVALVVVEAVVRVVLGGLSRRSFCAGAHFRWSSSLLSSSVVVEAVLGRVVELQVVVQVVVLNFLGFVLRLLVGALLRLSSRLSSSLVLLVVLGLVVLVVRREVLLVLRQVGVEVLVLLLVEVEAVLVVGLVQLVEVEVHGVVPRPPLFAL